MFGMFNKAQKSNAQLQNFSFRSFKGYLYVCDMNTTHEKNKQSFLVYIYTDFKALILSITSIPKCT